MSGEQVSWWLIGVLCPLFALVAGLYASVGLGGGTGYLAIMALVGMPARAMPSTALLLNLVVTGAALLRYGLAGRLKWPLFLPFLVPAIPGAFVGGLLTAPKRVFLVVLALGLGAAAAAMFRSAGSADAAPRAPERALLLAVGLAVGLVIGVLSGFIGIGGGVFLGPVILFLRWAGPKEVAAMNSALILVLSAVGLAAHGVKGAIHLSLVAPFAVAVLAGGLLGAHLAERKLSAKTLQRVFAVIILLAGLKAALDAIGAA